MRKIGYPWIVGVYPSIAIGIFLFVFVRNAILMGTSNLIVMFASIVIGAPVGVIISSKIIGKVQDSKFSIHKAIMGIILAFSGCIIGAEIGIFFGFKVFPLIYGRIFEGAGLYGIPGLMGGAIGGAIGGYSKEIKTGIIGGAIGGLISSTLTGIQPVIILERLYETGNIYEIGSIPLQIFVFLPNGIEFGIVGAIAGASLGMIAGAIGRIIATSLNKNSHQ